MTNIIHDQSARMAYMEVNGYTAEITYLISGNKLIVNHTYVPNEIGQRGYAAQLVEYIYNFAVDNNLQFEPTCWYAARWLRLNATNIAQIIQTSNQIKRASPANWKCSWYPERDLNPHSHN